MDDTQNKRAGEEEGSSISLDGETVVYELGYHLLSSVKTEDIPTMVGKVKAVLEKHGGVVIAEEFPTLIRLAYTMVRRMSGKHEKYDTAHFGWVKFELPNGLIQNVKEDLNRNELLLRFLIIRTVRENTRIPRRIVTQRDEDRGAEKAASPRRAAAPVPVVSDEELDRTIEELVAE